MTLTNIQEEPDQEKRIQRMREEIEKLGTALMKLEEKMNELKRTFGLSDDDLNLKLGPVKMWE